MTETTKSKKWTNEAVAALLDSVGGASPVSAASVDTAAAALGVTARSVASKLRQLDREVASLAKEKVAAFSAEQTAELSEFVSTNSGSFTYKEIAAEFNSGSFSPKQIQGKLLALELTSAVKPAEKVETARTYTEAEESTFVLMANGGKFIEEIAAALGKTVASIRGKALSLTRNDVISKIPAQRESHAKDNTDALEALGDAVATMTVAEIAVAIDKTDRGVKTVLTRRGIKASDYDGAAKRAKAEAKAVAA